MIKVVHCINSFSSLSGGVGFALKNLIENYNNVEHIVLTLSDSQKLLEINSKRVKIKVFKRNGPFNFSYSKDLEVYLINFISKNTYSVVHMHGLWSGLSYSILKTVKLTNVKLIISPHGMLSKFSLRRRFFQKKILAYLFEKKLFSIANYIHALNNFEKKCVSNFCRKSTTKIIPHAYNFTFLEKNLNNIWKKRVKFRKKLIYLGRIHKTKGLFELLDAVKLIKYQNLKLNFDIEIIGFGEKQLVMSIKKYIDKNNLDVNISGPAFGDMKKKKFMNSHGIILPSMTEGFPMSLVEASSYGLPLFVTKESNIDWVNNGVNGFSFDFNVKNIKKLLINFNNASHENLMTMGIKNYFDAKINCDSSQVNNLWTKLYYK